MSTGLYIHVTRAPGTIVSAALYNGDHQVHVTNAIPTSAGAHADDLTQWRATTDPAPAGTPTPVAAVGTEFEQIRYSIAQIKTVLNGGTPPTYWYSTITPATSATAAKGARIYHSITSPPDFRQSIPAGTATTLDFDTADYDTGVVLPTFDPFFFDGLPTRLTITYPGVYALGTYLEWESSGVVLSGAEFFVALRLNGTTVIAVDIQGSDGNGQNRYVQLETVIGLVADDYIEVVVAQTSGGSLNVMNPRFWIGLIGLTAVVPPPTIRTLTVSSTGSGTGVIMDTPGTINGPSGTDMFVDSTTTMLTATPNAGSVFVKWSGDVPGGHETDNPVLITFDANKTIAAEFEVLGAIVGFIDGGSASFSGTRFLAPTTLMTLDATETNVQVQIPIAITLTNLYIKTHAALAAGVTLTATFSVNAVSQAAITVSMATGDQVKSASGVVSVAAGQLLTVKLVQTGGTAVSIDAITATYHAP